MVQKFFLLLQSYYKTSVGQLLGNYRYSCTLVPSASSNVQNSEKMMHFGFGSPGCFQRVHTETTNTSLLKAQSGMHWELLSQQEEPNLNSLSSTIAHSIAAASRSLLKVSQHHLCSWAFSS